MIKLSALLGTSLLVVAASIQDSPKPSVPANEMAALRWLAGEWRGKVGPADVVSWHSDPDGGMIVMATKELTGGKVSLFDFGVVTAKEGQGIAFVPYPYGKPSVPFLLTGFDPRVERASFENAQHDFPKKFLFERTAAGNLKIVLTGDEQGQPMTVEYELKRAKEN